MRAARIDLGDECINAAVLAIVETTGDREGGLQRIGFTRDVGIAFSIERNRVAAIIAGSAEKSRVDQNRRIDHQYPTGVVRANVIAIRMAVTRRAQKTVIHADLDKPAGNFLVRVRLVVIKILDHRAHG